MLWRSLGLCAAILVVALIMGCGGGDGSSDTAGNSPGLRIDPATTTIAPGAITSLTAVATGGAIINHLTWTIREENGKGTLTTNASTINAQYKAPGTPGIYHIDVIDDLNSQLHATATITVSASTSPQGTLQIAVSKLPVQTGDAVTLTATLTGTTDTGVSWHIREDDGGTLETTDDSHQVIYHAPSADGIYHIIAVSDADSRINTAIAIAVGSLESTAMCVSPGEVALTTGQQYTLKAGMVGGNLSSVRWYVVEGNGGSYTSSSTPNTIKYTASSTPGTYHVTASHPTWSDMKVQAEITVRPSEPPLRAADWVLGTWQGSIPTTSTLFANTRIRVQLNGTPNTISDGVDGSYRYGYTGTLTWDIGGANEWTGTISDSNATETNLATWEDNTISDWETVHVHAAKDATHTVDITWSARRGSITTAPTSLTSAWAVRWGGNLAESDGVSSKMLTLQQVTP